MNLRMRSLGAVTALALLASVTGGGVSVAATESAAIPSGAVLVPVGDHPSSIAVSPTGRNAYVTAAADDVVSIVDLVSRTLIQNVAVGTDPLDAVLDVSGKNLYVANSGSGTISVLDTRTRTVIRTLTVGGFPNAIDLRHIRTGDVLYVADIVANTVSQIDTATGAVTANWPVPAPTDVVVTGDGQVVAPSNFDTSVAVIDVKDGSLQVLQRPDKSSSNPGASSGSSTTVAVPGVAGTVWLNTATMTFTGQVSAIAPGVTSGSDLIPGGRLTVLTTRDFTDSDPIQPGKVSIVRTGTSSTLAVLPVGVGPRAVASSVRGLLIAQGPAENGGFGLLIIPWRALLSQPYAP